MDRDEYRRSSLANWQTMAAGWERRREDMERITAPVREWLVRALAPQPGETILELAAGPGDTGFAAAPLLGDAGRLITTDFSPEMTDVARRRGDELGLHNVEYRTMDAEHLELEDDSVDGTICRFGFMLMVETGAALAETRRVLRPGGRLVFATWRAPEQNPWVSVAGRILVARGLMPPNEPGAPGMFTMAADEIVESLLEDASFTDVRIEDVPVRFAYDDIGELRSPRPGTPEGRSRGPSLRPPRWSSKRSPRSSSSRSLRSPPTAATSCRASRSSRSHANRAGGLARPDPRSNCQTRAPAVLETPSVVERRTSPKRDSMSWISPARFSATQSPTAMFAASACSDSPMPRTRRSRRRSR